MQPYKCSTSSMQNTRQRMFQSAIRPISLAQQALSKEGWHARLQHFEQRGVHAARDAHDVPVAGPCVLRVEAQHAEGRPPELAEVHLQHSVELLTLLEKLQHRAQHLHRALHFRCPNGPCTSMLPLHPPVEAAHVPTQAR